MRVLKIVAVGFGVLIMCVVVLIGVTLAIAPMLDGPVNRIAGGPFKQPAVAFSVLDPAALVDESVIEIEVKLESRPSVEVAVLVDEAKIYVPATLQPAEKRWPKAIAADPRVRLRARGRVVDAQAVRVTDDALHQRLARIGASKYSESYFRPEDTWFYEIRALDDE